MNILSLFDGMGCARVALDRLNINVTNYYASEVDKYAIQISQKNYPDTIQLGDVTKIKAENLPKIDLLVGGSPCTQLSFAGKRTGLSTKDKQDILTLDKYLELKEKNFEFDGQSYLFWEYVRLLKELKPKYFLLENVVMAKKWENIFSSVLGVTCIKINSAKLSAQNRNRLYWTNIPNITQPEDKCILLKDIVFGKEQFCGRVVGRKLDENGVRKDNSNIKPKQRLELRTDNKSGTITTVQKDNMLLSEKAIQYMNRKVKGGRTHWDFNHHSDIKNEKSSTVVANFFKGVPYNVLKDDGLIRKFHPIEVERLQTLEDNYTEGVFQILKGIRCWGMVLL
jgi:DNA-cytosine methyltransferase